MCGRTRVRSLSDPTVGHATEVADPICRMEEILCRIMDNGREHDTGPNRTVNPPRMKNLVAYENRATILRFYYILHRPFLIHNTSFISTSGSIFNWKFFFISIIYLHRVENLLFCVNRYKTYKN